MRISRTDKLLLGVCGGIADRYGLDSFFVRLAFFLAFWFLGLGFIAYIIIWLLME